MVALPSKAARLEFLQKQRSELSARLVQTEKRKRELFAKFFEDNFHEVQSLRKLMDVVNTSASFDERYITAMFSLASKCHAVHYRKCNELLLEGIDPNVIYPIFDEHDLALNGGTIYYSQRADVPPSVPPEHARFWLTLQDYEVMEQKNGRKTTVYGFRHGSENVLGLADYYSAYAEAKNIFITDEIRKQKFSQLVSFVAKNNVKIADIWEYVCYDTMVLKKRNYEAGSEQSSEVPLVNV